MSNLKKIIVGTYLFTVFYAVIRYHVFGGVLWKDFFIFTLNKILIFSAIIFLYFSSRRFLDKQAKDFLKKTITVSIVLHIIFSTIILKPYYLKGFFHSTDGLSLTGNISLLAGSFAAVIFLLKSQIDIRPVLRTKIFIVLAMIHLLAMGIKNWLHPAAWYGGFLPITLISFLILGIVFWKKVKA